MADAVKIDNDLKPTDRQTITKQHQAARWRVTCWGSATTSPMMTYYQLQEKQLLIIHTRVWSITDMLTYCVPHEMLLPRWLTTHMSTIPPGFTVIWTLCQSDSLVCCGRDSHDRGGARLSSCLMQRQNKLTSLHESPPVSRKEVFCCQKEEVTLCVRVPFYFQKTGDIVSAQCFGMEIQLFGLMSCKDSYHTGRS